MASKYDLILDGEESRLAAADTAAIDYGSIIDAGDQAARRNLIPANDPDGFARAKQLERTTGVPAEVVQRNVPRVAERARLAEASAVLATSPTLAHQVADDADFAHLGSDELPLLAQLGNSFQRGWRSLQQVAPAVRALDRSAGLAQLDAIDRGESVEPEALGVLGEAYLEADADGRAAIRQRFGSGLNATLQDSTAALTRLESEKRTYPAAPVVQQVMGAATFSEALRAFGESPLDFLASIGPESVVASLPGVAAAVPATFAAGPIGGAAAIGGGSFIADFSGSFLEALNTDIADPVALGEALADPVRVRDAAAKASRHASVVAAFDAVSAGVASKVPNALVQAVSQPALGAAGEAGGQLAAGDEIAPGAILAEAVGELIGAPLEVAAVAAPRLRKAVTHALGTHNARVEEATAATQDAAALDALASQAAQSRLRDRDQAAFKAYIDRAIDESGAAPSDLFISSATLARALDAANVKPEELATLAPELAEQMSEVAVTGGDIVIRTSDFAARLAGTPVGSALLPHLRTSPEGMSAAEARDFYAGARNAFAADVEAALNPEPQVLEAAQMSPTDWAAAQEDARTAQALTQLDARTLRDMRWLSNAKLGKVAELKRDAAAKRKIVRAEVAPVVEREPVYAAQAFVKRGVLPDGELLGDLTGEHKFSAAALREMYGDAPASPRRYIPTNMVSAEGGLHPDLVAPLFGFGNGDALVRAMIDAPPLANAIDAATDLRMLEQFGDLSDPQVLERAAEATLANEARARTLSREIGAINRTFGAWPALVTAANAYADSKIETTKIRDLRVPQHVVAEGRANREATASLKRGETREVARFKRQALLSNRLARATAEERDYVDTQLAYLKRVSGSKTIDVDYRDQIDQLLERFDLRAQLSLKTIDDRKSLLAWVKIQEEANLPVTIDERLLNDARRQSYKELTVAEFRGLVDAVKNIEHLGRLKQKLLTAKDQREFEAVVSDAAASIREHANRDVVTKIERNLPTDRARELGAGYLAMHRKLPSLVREMDGGRDGGVMWERFLRPLNEAGNAEAVMRERATMTLAALFKPLSKLRELMPIPEIGRSLSREARLAVALNVGNVQNRQRILDGERWSPAQLQAILDTLTKEDWDFVQGTWDALESYWSEIAAKERRVSGVEPEKVAATVVNTRFGPRRGGYYPMKYDAHRSTQAEAYSTAEALKQAMQGAFTRATTRRGHTKARAEQVERAVRLDLGVITEHVNQVIHDLTHHEALIDTSRLLGAKAIDAAIREHYGPEILKALRAALSDIAVGEVPAQNVFETSMARLRAGVSIAGMGWSLMTSALQPLGLTQSMVRIGPRWVGRGLAQWLGDAARMQNTLKDIHARSDFMRLRDKTLNRELNEITNRVRADGGVKVALEASYFYFLQKMQLVADVPTWLGQYEKSIAAGHDEVRSIALADQAVVDSQGGGQIKDLAQIQRGSPLQKLFTSFYSYFSTTYNLSAEAVRRTQWRDPVSVGRLAVDFLLLYTLPAVLGVMLKDTLRGSTDDEDELAEKLIREQLSYLSGTMIGVRELSGFLQGFSNYSGPAGARVFSELSRLGTQVSQGEIDEALLRAANSSAGILFPYPAAQLDRTVRGINAVLEGDAPPSAVLFGPPPGT